MSIDPEFVELTADVVKIFLLDHRWRRSTAKRDSLESEYDGGWKR